METMYVGDFQCLNDLAQVFDWNPVERRQMFTKSTVVYAAYNAPSLENKAYVLYHFSGYWCMVYAQDRGWGLGLTDQWNPHVTTLANARWWAKRWPGLAHVLDRLEAESPPDSPPSGPATHPSS